jgi:hypothetical protein
MSPPIEAVYCEDDEDDDPEYMYKLHIGLVKI